MTESPVSVLGTCSCAEAAGSHLHTSLYTPHHTALHSVQHTELMLTVATFTKKKKKSSRKEKKGEIIL